MSESSKKNKRALLIFRFSVVCVLTGGFVYQTLEFLFLYWTYPTVVDIQESSPAYLEVPAFTFCNRVGYNYKNFCKARKYKACMSSSMTGGSANRIICKHHPEGCVDGKLPKKFKIIFYSLFMRTNAINQEDILELATPLKKYLKCTIEISGKTVDCNMENVLGSFYSIEDLPQFCYTIYSKWGNPNKTREKIPKGAVMKFELLLNSISFDLNSSEPEGNESYPRVMFNPPSNMAVQIAVHSPYFLPSPHFDGSSFLGGRDYRMHIKLTTIQECRINVTYKALGCIPVTIDYPHSYQLCKKCPLEETNCPWSEPPNNCTMLADNYNQPCDSITYNVEKENVPISFEDEHGLRHTSPEHDCSGTNILTRKCATVHIDVPFDRFTISGFTYNAKYESLELFSVIGGYMGMWLGISLLAVFDLMSEATSLVRSFLARKKMKNQQEKIVKIKLVERI